MDSRNGGDPGKSDFARSFYKSGDKNCHSIRPPQPPLYQDVPISCLLIDCATPYAIPDQLKICSGTMIFIATFLGGRRQKENQYGLSLDTLPLPCFSFFFPLPEKFLVFGFAKA